MFLIFVEVIQKFHGDGQRAPQTYKISQVPLIKLNSKLVRSFHRIDYEVIGVYILLKC